MYSTTLVKYLYISCYVTVNKLVLSYLYTVPLYTPTHTHTSAATSAGRSLFSLRKWSFHSTKQCTLHWLQLRKRFLLQIPLRNPQIFFSLLEVSRSYHSTQFWTRYLCCSYFCPFLVRSSTLGWHPTQHLFVYQVFSLTLFALLILCVSVSNLHSKTSLFFYALTCQFVLFLAPQWLRLGRVPNKPLDFANLFWTFKNDSWRSGYPWRTLWCKKIFLLEQLYNYEHTTGSGLVGRCGVGSGSLVVCADRQGGAGGMGRSRTSLVRTLPPRSTSTISCQVTVNCLQIRNTFSFFMS